jgi:membrane protein involved in colicin uptake
MSWVNPAFKLKDLIKTAEKMVEEDKRREFAAAEAVRLAAELKVKLEAEAKAAAELKVKLEAEAAAELKARLEAEAKAAALKKTTITCVKGKLTKKVTAVKPKCPSGYKLKK